MRSASERRKASSGDISPSSSSAKADDPVITAASRNPCQCLLGAPLSRGMTKQLGSFQLHLDRRALPDGLIHHAIALGELEQLIELFLRRVGVDVEGEADLR